MKWMLFILLFPALCFAQEPEMVLPEVEPEFPGGQRALEAFIQENIDSYLTPEDGDCHILLTFIVYWDGQIGNIIVEEGCSQTQNTEAVRLLRIMPAWEPGLVKDKPVNTKCRLPINITAPTEKDYKITLRDRKKNRKRKNKK